MINNTDAPETEKHFGLLRAKELSGNCAMIWIGLLFSSIAILRLFGPFEGILQTLLGGFTLLSAFGFLLSFLFFLGLRMCISTSRIVNKIRSRK